MNGIRLSLAAAGLLLVGVARAEGPEPAAPRLRPMPFEVVRDRTFAWTAAAAKSEAPPEEVRRIWENAEPGLPARGVHELVVRSFAAVDPATAELIGAFDPRNPPLTPPDTEAALNASSDGFYRTNLSLHVGRLLTDTRMYDEALGLFESADLAQAVDPATALFYRAVCEHQLLMKEEGLKTLALLDAAEAVPESYVSVARLMRAELEALEPESLDEVAGLMRDVGRRLELARGGQRVQKKEDEIAAKLDEIIKKIEQQMSQSSSSGGSNGGRGNRSNSPLGDSVVKGSTAPGKVDPKTVRRDGDWGDLSPREREQVRSDVEKNLPPGYWKAISEYTTKRARLNPPVGDGMP
jgi:hypothetical protein